MAGRAARRAPCQHGAGVDRAAPASVSGPRRCGVCQPVAPSGAGGRCSSVWVSPSASVARTRIAVLARRGVPVELPLDPRVAARRRRRASASRHGAVVDLDLDPLRCRAVGAQATPAIGCVPAATVAPLRGTSMRDCVLIGPSLDQPRGIQ